MICRILSNRVYLGNTVQGKTVKLSYKSGVTRRNSREDWIEIKNTHAPLVWPECFQAARSRSAARRKAPKGQFKNVFSGIAFCADCGRRMTTAPSRKKGVSYKLCCGAYKAGGAKSCTSHFIDYEPLLETVEIELRRALSLESGERAQIERELANMLNGPKQHSGRAEEHRAEIQEILKTMYEDRALGRLSTADYDRMALGYEAELRELDFIAGESEKTEIYMGNMWPPTLTRELLAQFVDRIEIGQGEYVPGEDGRKIKQQRIMIRCRF